MKSKAERLQIFMERLGAVPSVDSADKAFKMLADVLNEVENEFTDVCYNPQLWMSDGRMYPPQADSARTVKGHPDITRYRNRGHNVWIASNGAVAITRTNGPCLLSKAGSDGKMIPESILTPRK